jgi:hypothetical protein
MNSASLCRLADRYDNSIPTRFLAPIDCLKIPAQDLRNKTADASCRKENLGDWRPRKVIRKVWHAGAEGKTVLLIKDMRE